MISYREIETIITDKLKDYLGCEVIMANQNTPIPKYPYVSYTVITPLLANNGTFGVYEDGYKRKEIQQVWSFTVQSDDDTQSKLLAIKAHDFFSEIGWLDLNDNQIVVRNVETITCRDNFLTIGYEYRNGFDVTFALMNTIKNDDEIIEEAPLNFEK